MRCSYYIIAKETHNIPVRILSILAFLELLITGLFLFPVSHLLQKYTKLAKSMTIIGSFILFLKGIYYAFILNEELWSHYLGVIF